MRGRKPKPNALKVLAGNPGKRPIKEELAVAGDVPDCPDHLDERAQKEWKRLVTMLGDSGSHHRKQGA
jgi:phage terminase small subunit